MGDGSGESALRQAVGQSLHWEIALIEGLDKGIPVLAVQIRERHAFMRGNLSSKRLSVGLHKLVATITARRMEEAESSADVVAAAK